MTDRAVNSTSSSNSADTAARLAANTSPETRPSGTTPAGAMSEFFTTLKQASPLDAGTMLRSLDTITGDRALTDALACATGVIPSAPPPPEETSTGIGSGPHGAVEPTMEDRVIERGLQFAAGTADANGFHNAAANLRHYLDNSGTTLQVDPNAMLTDVPDVAWEMDRAYRVDIINEAETFVRENFSGQPMCFTMTSDWRTADFGNKSVDWNLAVGGASYAHTALVTVTPEPNGLARLSIDSQLHIFDRYNWDGGKATNIEGFIITDEFMGRMHATGLAQEYEIRGSTDLPKVNNHYVIVSP